MRSDFGGSDTPVNIRDLWQTPFNIYQNLNDEFNFVGDVAASDINHLHMNYLTEEDDA
ncbi:DNA N-6-adenine-methyltransferase, partial [Kocuria sp. CPCC 205274]